MTEDPVVLEGAISVRAALEARSREIEIVYIQRDKRTRETALVRSLARSSGARTRFVPRDFIEERATGRSHGGVIALAGPREHASVDALISGKSNPFVVMLDGLEDPFNFGHAVRSLYAAGVDGLVVRPRDWRRVDGTIARASAGASELMPTAVVDTAMEAAKLFRERGLTAVCAARGQRAVSLYDANLSGSVFLVIGGEKRGISRPLIEMADLLIRIPYGRRFAASLGMAEAVTAVAFEALRQRAGRE